MRVPAKILGYNGNLLGLEKEYLGIEVNINKKKNQQANWLKRPIDVDLMEPMENVNSCLSLEKAFMIFSLPLISCFSAGPSHNTSSAKLSK